jgi:SNF2 family DNA or RNA helicase
VENSPVLVQLTVDAVETRFPTHGFLHSLEEAAKAHRAEVRFNSSKKKFVFTYAQTNPTHFNFKDLNLDVLTYNEVACSCDEYVDDYCNSCIHSEALLRSNIQSRVLPRKNPIIHFDTLYRKLVSYGTFAPHDYAAFGLKAELGEVTIVDQELFDSCLKIVPANFTGSVHNFYSRPRAPSTETIPNFDLSKKTPFPFQKEGISFLVNTRRACLADDLGCGKTMQTITATANLDEQGLIERVLIICPSSLKGQWEREIQECLGAEVSVQAFHATKDLLAYYYKHNKFPKYSIFSYEYIKRNMDIANMHAWSLIVLDEAQKIKNPNTKGYKNISSLNSDYMFMLTGTPIENRLGDIYHLMKIVDKNFLGPEWLFNYKHNVFDEKGRLEGHKNVQELQKKLKEKVLRREKHDVLKDLPEMLENTRYIEMLPQQKVVEQRNIEIAMNILRQSGGRELSFNEKQIVQQCLVKARLACDAPELVGVVAKTSPKLDELEELLQEIEPTEHKKVIIFSEWVKMLELTIPRLKKLGLDHVLFTGQIDSKHRQGYIDQFNNDPKKTVFLSSDAGGVGLNLQVASYVIHLDLPWNPARLDQRSGRAHRIGQKNNVSVTYIVAENSIEQGIEGVLQSKRAIRQSTLSEGSDLVMVSSFMDYMKESTDGR